MSESPHKAYVVAVDMGYGHERAAFSLRHIATKPAEWNIPDSSIITANKYPGIPPKDKVVWEGTRIFYEWVSRMNSFPIFGKRLFRIMDIIEFIPPFYPRRDLSRATIHTCYLYWLIRLGFGKHLISVLNKNPLPSSLPFL
jgi:hypothetical protein